MFKTTGYSVAGVLASILLAASAGAAVQAVDWGGQYVDNTQVFADSTADPPGSDSYGDPDGPFTINATDTVVGRAFNSTTPWSPNPANYSGTSDTFYGGGSATVAGFPTNDGFTELSVLNQGSNDSLHYHVDTGHDNHTFHLAIFWDKSDFLGGLSATPNLGFGDGVFTLETAQSSGHHTDELLRWLVRDGNQFYISEGFIFISNNSDYSVPMASLTNWAPYDPAEAAAGSATSADLLSIDFDETGPYSPHTFTDVTALGFYVEHEAATGPVHVHIEGFGASIPEPSGVLLLCTTLIGALCLRRRRG